MSDLRECPWCGGRAELDEVGGATGLQHFASCKDMTCPGYHYQPYTTYARKNEALAAWNRRAPSADHVPDAGKMVAPATIKADLTVAAAYRAGAEAMRERAAEQVDCGCSWRADALAATNKGERFVACGNDPCGAIEARAIRALPLPAGGSGWRPIETAPRDGTAILVFNDRGHFVAEWNDDWWSVSDGKMERGLRGQEPTHWQPLPAAPEEGEAT